MRLEISVGEQRLRLRENGTLVMTCAISTSKWGLGSKPGSNQTPVGRFRVAEKHGDGAPIGTIFRSRKPVGHWNPRGRGARRRPDHQPHPLARRPREAQPQHLPAVHLPPRHKPGTPARHTPQPRLHPPRPTATSSNSSIACLWEQRCSFCRRFPGCACLRFLRFAHDRTHRHRVAVAANRPAHAGPGPTNGQATAAAAMPVLLDEPPESQQAGTKIHAEGTGCGWHVLEIAIERRRRLQASWSRPFDNHLVLLAPDAQRDGGHRDGVGQRWQIFAIAGLILCHAVEGIGGVRPPGENGGGRGRVCQPFDRGSACG